MKIFYIFRHGQTDLNLRGIWQGQKQNPPLNDNGILEAKSLSNILKDKKIEIIYTSDLIRAQQTAEIVAKPLGIKILKDIVFREISMGDMDGKEKNLIEKNFPDIYKKWRDTTIDTFDFAFQNGESKREAVERILSGLKKIASESEYNIMGIASHGGIIRWLSFYFNNPVKKVPNCAVIKIEYDGENFYSKGLTDKLD